MCSGWVGIFRVEYQLLKNIPILFDEPLNLISYCFRKLQLFMVVYYSGGFRNSERGVQPLAHEACSQIFGLPRPLSVTLEVRTGYLEATLGQVKNLEISGVAKLGHTGHVP